MQCEARSQVNQGESEGVDLRPRLKMSPLICQEIAHNAPPQVVFFTKNKTTPFFLKCHIDNVRKILFMERRIILEIISAGGAPIPIP